MAWSAAINCRDSAGYVTDVGAEIYCTGDDDIYPTVRGGLTFGWDGAVTDMGRNRDSGLDRRLAGTNQAVNSGTQTVFRLNLNGAGYYTVRLALGDGVFDQGYQYCKVADDTSVLFTIADTDGTLGANFDDAFGTSFSAASWAASNVARTGLLFSSGILKLTLGAPSAQSGSSTLAHLYVEQEVTGDTLGFGQMTSVVSRSRVVIF